jgi:hypothetical protein
MVGVLPLISRQTIGGSWSQLTEEVAMGAPTPKSGRIVIGEKEVHDYWRVPTYWGV